MLCLEILQIAGVDLCEIVTIRSPWKIIEHDEYGDHTAVLYNLTSNGPLIVSDLAVAPAEVFILPVVLSIHTSSITSVRSVFVYTIFTLVIGSEWVWTTGALWIEKRV